MWEMVIAECRKCGAKCYSWDEQDALNKLATHRCIGTLSLKELDKILQQIRDKVR